MLLHIINEEFELILRNYEINHLNIKRIIRR